MRKASVRKVVENLAGMWIAHVHSQGLTVDQGMRILNASTGRRYNYKRAWEWKRGKRAIPPIARRAMLRMSIGYILRCFGLQLSPERAQELVKLLT